MKRLLAVLVILVAVALPLVRGAAAAPAVYSLTRLGRQRQLHRLRPGKALYAAGFNALDRPGAELRAGNGIPCTAWADNRHWRTVLGKVHPGRATRRCRSGADECNGQPVADHRARQPEH
jgi:hypothetical protein